MSGSRALVAVAEDAGESLQLLQHSLVRRHRVGIDQLVRQPAHLGGKDLDQHPRRRRMASAQFLECRPLQHQRLDLTNRHGGGGPPALWLDKALFPEAGPRSENVEGQRVASVIDDPNRHVTLVDEMHAVAGVTLVEQAVARPVAPAHSGLQHFLSLLVVEGAQDVPGHRSSVTESEAETWICVCAPTHSERVAVHGTGRAGKQMMATTGRRGGHRPRGDAMNQYDKIRKSDLTEPTASVRAPQDDLEDTEGHKRRDITDAGDAEDTEGHRRRD